MSFPSLVALVHEESTLLGFDVGAPPMIPFNIRPEFYVHVNVWLLPAAVDHGFYHAENGLAELLKREVFILDDI
jgi:hypothetical protein